METFQVLSKINDQNQSRQQKFETPLGHTHYSAGVNIPCNDSVDVGDTLDGFYRNNDKEVDRIYNIPISMTRDNDYYCIPNGIPCQACQCLGKRRKLTARICVTTFVLLLSCLVLGTQLSNTVTWNVSPVESSQLKQQLKSNVDSVPGVTGSENNWMEGLSPKNLSIGSTNYGNDEIPPRPTNSST
ncbi:hypothetical protein MHU86_1908 [Fragilaria crotonensis]|nr:hypothetical protein MHU86_1908 [Fragilaria crotonensis]